MAAAATSAAASGLASRLHSLCSPSSLAGGDVGGASSRRCPGLSCALQNVSISSPCSPLEMTSSLGNLFHVAPGAAPTQSTTCPSSTSLLFGHVAKRASRMVSLRVRADIGEELEQVTSYGGVEDEEVEQETAAGTKLYVGNLPWKVDSESLAEVFESVGKVVYDRMTGRSRGFGFVTMGSLEEAQRAIDQLNGMELDQRILRVNFPQVGMSERRSGGGGSGAGAGYGQRPPRGQDNPNKLYVGNLAWGVDDVGLHDLFSTFGNVVEAKVVMDRESGRSRGFGFVTFEQDGEVNDAIQGLNGVDVDGRTLRVNLASSKPARSGGYGGRGGRGGYGGGRGDDGYGDE
ncbi:hypothetical protein CBR_g40343 [Chara braunii]|uniref:RRM domain-containing protein n=1 Tax=Chara braunii TaxID=69332 RepID=A0A388LTN0_CHABU|nr:hypothetical protein CBR_g40343 [Chara braunii]|eukprot:GBG85615.1 hypothetical protein CBR_g40343 [Chara braunii]